METLQEFMKSEGLDSEIPKSSSKARNGRAQRRARRNSRVNGVRQLADDRRLDVAVILDTLWLLVCGTFVFFMHA